MVSSSTSITSTLPWIIQSRLCLKLISSRMLLRNALTFKSTDEKLYRSSSAQSSRHWTSYFHKLWMKLRSSSTRFEGCKKCISEGKTGFLSSYSPVSTEIRLGLEDAGTVFQFPAARSKLLFSNASIRLYGSPSFQFGVGHGRVPKWEKRSGCVACHYLLVVPRLILRGVTYLHSPYAINHGVVLKHKNNFTFYKHSHNQ